MPSLGIFIPQDIARRIPRKTNRSRIQRFKEAYRNGSGGPPHTTRSAFMHRMLFSKAQVQQRNDPIRHENLRACALRVGQQLNLGWDHLSPGETLLQQEERRRLWWETVICEWLSTPGKPLCIISPGFDCALPLVVNDYQLLRSADLDPPSSDPLLQVKYHIIMARIATVDNELKSKLCACDWVDTGIANFVNAADNDLAAIVDVFYIKNHGIHEDVINAALGQAKPFFHQPESEKQKVSRDKSCHFNGLSRRQTSRASPSESLDNMEQFAWCYDPQYDPETKDLNCVPEDIKSHLNREDYIWDGMAHMPRFKDDCIRYWQRCVQLARGLLKIFALGLDLPEDYFDSVTTDAAFNFYPAATAEQILNPGEDIGLGSHANLQCLTLLWQDSIGGLQVLTNDGQCIKAPPIPGTFVVNIGDYLMRFTNDQFKSTVHKVV